MLGMKTYPKPYIEACKARVAANLAAYRSLKSADAQTGFETRYFNNQVLLLDYMFVHRLAGIEGKDGNPLNEVRVLCNSLLLNAGKVQVSKLADWPTSAVSNLTLPVERSRLKLKDGDKVEVTEDQFVELSAAFFAELETRYG